MLFRSWFLPSQNGRINDKKNLPEKDMPDSLLLSFLQGGIYLIHNHLRCNLCHTGPIPPETRLLAEDRTGTTRKIELNGIFRVLMITVKSGIGMRCSPDRNHFCIDQRSEMHIGRVHTKQYVQAADQGKFIIQRITDRKSTRLNSSHRT